MLQVILVVWFDYLWTHFDSVAQKRFVWHTQVKFHSVKWLLQGG